ncbi:hypothetical protein DB41_KK00050 [Neochlamydia sp. TUME1]|uniref:hypothetical protein n=1 Tax=Neochlamydia sp. TUME1 TaxID=1478174 RepID=UPI00057CF51E|nr:hypothetical protein [Neochlamydia sp. TUME1]KIC72479.1 hypothetical protein DB41_KK00050 [Neochlamydia sp. TUME1]
MHFISLGSNNFSACLFFKNNIKKLKKQVKTIRILINEKQLTDNLPRFFQIDSRKGRIPSKHLGAATGSGD